MSELKKPIGISVLDAAGERIAWTFDMFDRIYLSFSGGKDSTVMLHLVMDEAKRRDRKVAVLVVDLEGQFKFTEAHIRECLAMYSANATVYWCCLPIHLRNAVSVYEPFWICWDKDKRESWIREPPPEAILDETLFPFFRKGMEFEEFVPEFGKWYGDGELCACFVGIRTDESLNRFRTIQTLKKERLDGKAWTTRVVDRTYNIYPIYDWRTEDLWTYHARTKLPHNELYDMMHRAGLTPHQMRTCQPYGDDQRRGLYLYHVIEPETWARVVARVNGANGGSLYMQESGGNINGYRRVSKPDGHTWQSFAGLLVDSMPPKTKEHYENKLLLFQRWWKERGYPDGIPDEAEYALEQKRRVPSWRRIVKSLLRNDYWCKGIGYTQHKSEAYGKYLDLMRRRKAEWQASDS